MSECFSVEVSLVENSDLFETTMEKSTAEMASVVD